MATPASPTCVICSAPAVAGDRCDRHLRRYRRALDQREWRDSKGWFQIGFEVGSGFTLGSMIMLIPVWIFIVVVAGVCASPY